MTREQQKKLKELNKSLSSIIKSNVKSYGIKKKDYMVWGIKNELYFSLLVDLRERDGHCYCCSEELVKPLWLDDLFWDIMDMPENKSEPLSLRCVGAFALHGMQVYEGEQELMQWSVEELEQCVISDMEHFVNTMNHSDRETYDSIFDVSAYQGELQEILCFIHNQDYQKALERIQSMEDGGQFQNKGIWFREYAKKYCKKHISSGRSLRQRFQEYAAKKCKK